MFDSFIEEYHQAILKGEIIACENIKKQVSKLVHDIYNPAKFDIIQRDGTTKTQTFIYDNDKALKIINFIETFCKQSKAPFSGQPLELLLWQKVVISAIYGFVDSETGFRRYTECVLEISRKAGKSTLMSALATYHMICEKGFEIVVGANARHQADIIFNETRNMLNQNLTLSKRVKKRKYDLYHLTAYNVMKPIANNSNLDGLNTDIFFADEIAEYRATIMYDRVKGGQGVKNEPLIFLTSSGGFVRDGFFDDKIDYSKNVLNGVIEDYSFLSFLYELDDLTDRKKVEAQIEDKEMWQKVNPSLGKHRSYTEFAKLVKQAKDDISQRPEIYAKYFNLKEIDNENWVDYDQAFNSETFDLEEFRGCYCVSGFDLSQILDLTCGTLVFMKKGSDKKYVHQMYWMPKDLIKQKEKDDKVPYSKWIAQGWIRASGTSKIDHDDVVNWFVETVRKYDLYPRWNGYDRWGSREFIKKMNSYNYEMTDVIQGAKTFDLPIKTLKSDLIDKKVIYQKNPVLIWCLTNTKEIKDSNANSKPDKGKNAKKRIDGTVSLLDAYYVLLNNYDDFTNYL